MTTTLQKSRASLLKAIFIKGGIAVALSGNPSPVQAEDLDALLLTHTGGAAAPEAGILVDTPNLKGAQIGRYRVGAYVQTPDDMCLWFCVDVDGGADHKRSIADTLSAALKVSARATALRLPHYLEKSGGASGWHIWGFFSSPQTLEVARTLALGLCPLDCPLTTGGHADPLLGHGFEVFPKSFLPKSTGNMVWLPWWHGAKITGGLFYDLDSLMPIEITRFDLIPDDTIKAALAEVPPAENWVAARSSSTVKKAGSKVKAGTAEPADETSDEFKAWRKEALAKVDLEEVFSPYLQEQPAEPPVKDWLKCRDPFNPPDTSPSAGVSTGLKNERGAFHSFIAETSLSLFDYLVKIGTVPNLASAFRYIARVTNTALPTKSPRADASRLLSGDTRPQIILTGLQLDAVVDASWQHLSESMKDTLFLRSNELVRVKQVDPELLPRLEPLTAEALRHYLSRSIKWYQVKGDELQATYPPKEIASDMLAVSRPDLLSPLDSVTCVPTFDAQGVLCLTPGYHHSIRAWYEPRGLALPDLDEHPCQEEVEGAKALLSDELLGEFKFSSPSDKTHFIGALILPFVRPMISGCLPLTTFESPTEGTGKGLLVSLIGAVALGLDIEIGGLPEEETEIRQRLYSELLSGKPIVAFDNANSEHRKKIDSAALEGVLTSNWWTERKMHSQSVVGIKNRAIWFLTGVNLLFSKGIRRRRVRVRLDPKLEDPWRLKADHFKKAMPQWAFTHRAQLVAAVITLVRSWLAKGRPMPAQKLGRYEAWSEVIGGILTSAGFPGWLAYLTDEQEQVTEENRSDWHELCARWVALKPGLFLTAADVNKLAEGDGFAGDEPLLVQYRRGENPRGQSVSLSKELLRRRDQVFGPHRLVAAINKKKGQTVYGLESGTSPISDLSTLGASAPPHPPTFVDNAESEGMPF